MVETSYEAHELHRMGAYENGCWFTLNLFKFFLQVSIPGGSVQIEVAVL